MSHRPTTTVRRYTRGKDLFLLEREKCATTEQAKRLRFVPWDGECEPPFEVEQPWDGKE